MTEEHECIDGETCGYCYETFCDECHDQHGRTRCGDVPDEGEPIEDALTREDKAAFKQETADVDCPYKAMLGDDIPCSGKHTALKSTFGEGGTYLWAICPEGGVWSAKTGRVIESYPED